MNNRHRLASDERLYLCFYYSNTRRGTNWYQEPRLGRGEQAEDVDVEEGQRLESPSSPDNGKPRTVVVEHVIGSVAEILKPMKGEALFGIAADERMLLCGGTHGDVVI
jgi:hypothetical protein